MNWLREHIKKLLANRRWRSRWKVVGAALAVLVVLAVVGGLSQGASTLSGSLNSASMGVQANDAATASDSPSNAQNPDKGTLMGAKFYRDQTGGGTVEVGDHDTVEANSRVQFSLSFEFPQGTLSDASEEAHTVTYTLPEGISVSEQDAQKKEIKGTAGSGEEGKTLGTFEIVGDKLVIVFDDSQVPHLYNSIVSTTVSFWATAQNSSVKESTDIVFPGGGTLHVGPVTPRIQVSKKASKQQNASGGDAALDDNGNQSETGTNRPVNYTITVGSTTGTGDTVSIDDTMSSGENVAATSYDKSSFKLVKYSSADDTTGKAVDFGDKLTLDEQDGKAHFKLAGLPALEKGERYVLTYKATVKEADHSADTSQTNSVKASIDGRDISTSGTAQTNWGNKGDIKIYKHAKLTDYANPDNPNEKHIQYQIVVTTDGGTGTRIQIGDTANPGTNIDTSSWQGHVTESFFDKSSFKLRKYTGTYENNRTTIDPNGGTDEKDKLENLAIGNDSGKPSLGLSIAEPLNKGEYYVLTYTGVVYEADHNAPDTTMNNQAVARIYPGGKEQKTDQVNAPVTWHNEIKKTGTFDEGTGYINWEIQVNRNNGDPLGTVMEDTLENALVSDVRVYRDNANSTETLVKAMDLRSGDHSVDTEGVANDPSTYDPQSGKLHVVLGSWATSGRPYTIKFSTEAPQDGTVSNTAVAIKNGTRYGSQGVNVGVHR